METSDRDLSFGRGQVWEEVQIWDKKWDGVDIAGLPTAEGEKCVENQDFAKKHYQNVDLDLNFYLGGSKPPKKTFLDQKILKIV